ncbi:hypothetical protein [Bradyrhizobium australiense]|uniref:Uncharacterized protein n=1 Tax=Bradyrhizobium australiense TaxID=2721161 RepID=A0A7Y4GSV4_9BRAD|nr:hypothetical protein [Bradyrhizobium australiense]NOJ41379.1 hypothetical protein [Bradyrhizobium australiense]
MPYEQLEVVDSSKLTDADWAQINELQRSYQSGGAKALNGAMKKLAKDHPLKFATVWHAFFPDMFREALKDSIAEIGLTAEDISRNGQTVRKSCT